MPQEQFDWSLIPDQPEYKPRPTPTQQSQQIDWSLIPDQPEYNPNKRAPQQPQQQEEQSTPSWLFEQFLRTAPAVAGSIIGGGIGLAEGGIGAIPGGMIGGSLGSAAGNIAGQWWHGDDFNPTELAVDTALGGLPPIFGPGAAAEQGVKGLVKYGVKHAGLGALEGGIVSGASTPFQHYAKTGSFDAPLEEYGANTAAGAVMGGTLGGVLGTHQGRSQQRAYETPPIPGTNTDVTAPPLPFEARPPAPSAEGVPAGIVTASMRARLRGLGLTDENISMMSLRDAIELINENYGQIPTQQHPSPVAPPPDAPPPAGPSGGNPFISPDEQVLRAAGVSDADIVTFGPDEIKAMADNIRAGGPPTQVAPPVPGTVPARGQANAQNIPGAVNEGDIPFSPEGVPSVPTKNLVLPGYQENLRRSGWEIDKMGPIVTTLRKIPPPGESPISKMSEPLAIPSDMMGGRGPDPLGMDQMRQNEQLGRIGQAQPGEQVDLGPQPTMESMTPAQSRIEAVKQKLAQQEPRWRELQAAAKEHGVNPDHYDNLDELEKAVGVAMRGPTASMEQLASTVSPVSRMSEIPKETWIRMEIGDRQQVLRNMVNTYQEQGAKVATKELLQNAIDETVNNGNIEVTTDHHGSPMDDKGPRISVQDHGTGLTLDVIQNEYVNLTGSGKRGQAVHPVTGRPSIGEMGVGKSTYLLGTDSFEVSTVAKEADGSYWKYEFEGTPEEMISGQIEVHKTRMPEGSDTGTKVTIFDKNSKNIEAAEAYLNSFGVYSDSPVNVTMKGNRYPFSPSLNLNHTVTPRAMEIGQSVHSGEVPGMGKYDIWVPDNAKWSEDRDATYAILTARGMFQGLEWMPLGTKGLLPDRIVVNIDPSVPAGNKMYPLTAPTRERMREGFATEIRTVVQDNLVAAAVAKRQTDLRIAYHELQPGINPDNPSQPLGFITHDRSGRFTPEEIDNFNRNPRIQAVASVMKKMLADLDQFFGEAQKTKTVAFGFDLASPTEYGVNFHNPDIREENKIMLNLPAMLALANGDADEAADFISHGILHEFTHNMVRSEDDAFTIQLMKNDARFGVRRRLEYGEAIKRSLDGGDGTLSQDLRGIVQNYTEAQGRRPTKVDYISRSSEGGFAREGGPERVQLSPRYSRERATPIIEKFRKNLEVTDDHAHAAFILPDGTMLAKSYGEIHKETAGRLGYTLDEVKRAGIVRLSDGAADIHGEISMAQARQIADARMMTGDESTYIDLTDYDGKQVSVEFHGNRSNAQVIYNWVNSRAHGQVDPNAGTVARMATSPPQTPPATKKSLWEKTKESTGWGQGGTAEQVKKKKELNWVKEVLAVPTGATTMLDFSAPGRQGLSMIATPQFWKAAAKMFQGLGAESFERIDAELKAKPMFQRRILQDGTVEKSMAEKIGTKIYAPASKLGPRAEGVASRWLEVGVGEGPISQAWKHTIGYPIRATNRAYITFLNHLNVNRTEYLLNRARDMTIQGINTGKVRPGILSKNVTPEQAMELNPYYNIKLGKEIADFVNTATGHGPLKTHILPHKSMEVNLEHAAKTLGSVLFSPGLLASRIRMLNPSTYIMASPYVRKQYLKAMISTGAAWFAFTEMAKMAGGDEVSVSNDVTSADFGKVRIGDTRLDAAGGFQQFLVAFGRFASGGASSSSTGEFHRFGAGYQAQTQEDMMQRFFVNKLNPTAKFAYDLASASQYNPFHVKDRMLQMFVPLVAQDLQEMASNNPELLPWMVPAVFGMGTQTYSKGESVGKLIAPEKDILYEGGGGILPHD